MNDEKRQMMIREVRVNEQKSTKLGWHVSEGRYAQPLIIDDSQHTRRSCPPLSPTLGLPGYVVGPFAAAATLGLPGYHLPFQLNQIPLLP